MRRRTREKTKEREDAPNEILHPAAGAFSFLVYRQGLFRFGGGGGGGRGRLDEATAEVKRCSEVVWIGGHVLVGVRGVHVGVIGVGIVGVGILVGLLLRLPHRALRCLAGACLAFGVCTAFGFFLCVDPQRRQRHNVPGPGADSVWSQSEHLV
jgi:hypothetical protein